VVLLVLRKSFVYSAEDLQSIKDPELNEKGLVINPN